MLSVAFSEEYAHPLPAGHRFPMVKYTLIPAQLLREGIIGERQIHRPVPCPDDILAFTHSPVYIEKLNTLSLTRAEERRTGFPLSLALAERERIIMQGTIDCALYALEQGAAANVAGGTHHAFYAHGEAFCLYNDIAVAANYLLFTKKIKKALVVDLDVHQGNGTASLFKGSDRVFTFSMHCRDNYPGKKEKSHLDIELPRGTGDDEYLDILSKTLPELIHYARPDILFFQSGVDIISGDKLGKLDLTPKGCAMRDEIVADEAVKYGIPVVAVMGGGYHTRLATIVDAHCNTFKILQKKFFEH